MAENKLTTIIVLRNDKSSNWATSQAILKPGELGISYLDNGNVVVKAGNGTDTWESLPQVESVLERDMLLTYNFGKHKVVNGSINAGGKDMTLSQWMFDALSEILYPISNYPSASLKVTDIDTDTGDTEVGSFITKISWKFEPNFGAYRDAQNKGTYGTSENKSSSETGISLENFRWNVTSSINDQASSDQSGAFILTSDDHYQIASEESIDYLHIHGQATLVNLNTYTPLNNIGEPYLQGKIEGFDSIGTLHKYLSNIPVACKGFRKPFWDTLHQPLNINQLSSDAVRNLRSFGSNTRDLPSSIYVPEGSKQVLLCMQANMYSKVIARDANAQNALVTFTKYPNKVSVHGANNYTSELYDVFAVTWGDPISSAKNLNLEWIREG